MQGRQGEEGGSGRAPGVLSQAALEPRSVWSMPSLQAQPLLLPCAPLPPGWQQFPLHPSPELFIFLSFFLF